MQDGMEGMPDLDEMLREYMPDMDDGMLKDI